MLNNVILFFKHVESSFLKQSKLKKKDFLTLHYELKRIVSDVQKNLVVHRQKVLRHKTDNQLTASQEENFMVIAKRKIPDLMTCPAMGERKKNMASSSATLWDICQF
ncbi:hypothetical protein FQN60_010573 [Etheostoma spectabile]|uniref:Uncharacterized protein n=1 Tax=Etheostoma spectabile TaxID=54343 RepID=A0A5J5CCS2_9PERO|nr:hypothetical protein FQN60_010573 [Etheostoma spectabile]